MRAALDTNLIVYAEERGPKGERALALMNALPPKRTVLPVQVCGELYNVLRRKSGLSAEAAIQVVDRWRDSYLVADTTNETMGLAMELSGTHRMTIWDAVILTAAAQTRCDLLLSEDLQDGFRWRGVTVVDPFAATPSPLLDAFLDQP